MFDETDSWLGNEVELGVYTDFYAMNYWQESFGFIAVIGAGSIYFIGLILSIIFDIKPQKMMKHKIFRDFRNIDRYGLRTNSELRTDEDSLNAD